MRRGYSTRVPAYRGRQSYTGPDLGTVLRVLDRDGHACVRCGKALRGDRGLDWSLQHRKPRGMGGTSDPAINAASNLLSVCGSGTTGCHGYMESERTEAEDKGWLIRRLPTAHPLTEPVLVARESRWVYLTDDAQYADNPPEET
jgi:hypothetical protein